MIAIEPSSKRNRLSIRISLTCILNTVILYQKTFLINTPSSKFLYITIPHTKNIAGLKILDLNAFTSTSFNSFLFCKPSNHANRHITAHTHPPYSCLIIMTVQTVWRFDIQNPMHIKYSPASHLKT